jgi:AbrB family looped-hinge helix DNA binding protein
MGDTRSVKVGPKGRVVIPQAARQQLGIEEGDELAVIVERDGVLLMPRERLLDSLRGMLADVPYSLADELIAERHAEAARDAAESER